jgi:hypothetical protein
MLMAGASLISPADPLQKVQDDYFYNCISHPKPEVENLIQQLRIVYTLDKRKYAEQKRQLPYVVCSVFNPPFRNTANFAYIDHFILDIDKLSQKQLSLDEVRKRVEADTRVLMCFASPSKDGLKVMFRLKERCADAGLYSIFYKKFVMDFSAEYDLSQVLDSVTSDVTRACFISIDPDAYFNPQAEPVDLSAVVDVDNPTELFDIKFQPIELPVEEMPAEVVPAEAVDRPVDPDREVMARIKATLNPQLAKLDDRPPVVVPEILNDIMDDLTNYVQNTGVTITEVINIQYGKKIRCKLGLKQSEVNLFYGHRGFSVVTSPRCGTDSEFNGLTHDLIASFINTYQG